MIADDNNNITPAVPPIEQVAKEVTAAASEELLTDNTEPAAPPQTLLQRLEVASWAACQWIELLERHAEPPALELGIEIAKRRRGPTVSIAPGEVSAMVPDPPRARRTVSFLSPAIDHEHWERAAKLVAQESILSARLLAGEFPPELDAVVAAADLKLIPTDGHLAVRRGRVHLEWDENVCAAAIAFARRLDTDPGLLLTFRGMTPDSFRELVRQKAALTTAGRKGAAAYAQRPPIGPDQEPPALELTLDTFWAAGPGLSRIETPIRPPKHPHSLLRRLGASPFENAAFPLIGLLATCYDLMSEAEVRRARDAEQGEDDTIED